jgi:hypothetical protein
MIRESGSVKLAWAFGLGLAFAAACSPASVTACSSRTPVRSWWRRSLFEHLVDQVGDEPGQMIPG